MLKDKPLRHIVIEYIVDKLMEGCTKDEIRTASLLLYEITPDLFYRCWRLAQPMYRSRLRDLKE